MIDWQRVSQLRDEIGEDDFDEVAELFLLEVEDTLARLDAALGDAEQLQELLHFLKGSALNLGFRRVSELCSQKERCPRPEIGKVDVDTLKTVYLQSRDLFEKEYRARFAA